MSEPLRDKKGKPLPCMHNGCYRPAVRIMGWDQPKHREFHGQTHNCCAVHSRGVEKDMAVLIDGSSDE